MPDYQKAVQLANAIITTIEEELPESLYVKAGDFFDSVLEKTKGILEYVEARHRVTEAQFEALQNMHDGVERWMQ